MVKISSDNLVFNSIKSHNTKGESNNSNSNAVLSFVIVSFPWIYLIPSISVNKYSSQTLFLTINLIRGIGISDSFLRKSIFFTSSKKVYVYVYVSIMKFTPK